MKAELIAAQQQIDRLWRQDVELKAQVAAGNTLTEKMVAEDCAQINELQSV